MNNNEPQQLYDEMVTFLPRLRRFAYGLTGSLDKSDDLVQRTYERAFKNHKQWQKNTRLDSWLFRIIQSIHYNDYKAEKVRGGHQAPVDPDLLECSRTTKHMENAMDLQVVCAKIHELPIDQREALLLVAIEQFSYAEAADMLNIPVGTLTSRLARARSKLSALLGASST